ncbi:TRAP transporter small permease [Marinobacter sp. 71-i]|uniref:TRAP transporter small permease protein n=1 Tax=Marinobacter iranensis TaxID=2962607 RepID=A0ABT5YAZ0_9GAMM|nr:TRAP transporter small permease [Marinobacter iranensis]MDF0750842.1 TRAP transporter small permease [Marinobacter iranensis]
MKLLRALERFNIFMGVASGVAIFLITLIVVADVALRALFRQPIPGATELSTLLMVALVYLGLASVQTTKSNFRMEVLINYLPSGIARILNLLTTLIALVAISIIAWYTTLEALHSLSVKEMSYGAVSFPIYPARTIIAIGFVLLALQLLIDAVFLLVGHDTKDKS